MADLNPAYSVEEHTAGDGYRWRYRRYRAHGTQCGELVILHGIQSHAGWYEYSCTRLARAGFGVSFLDRRGSGMNEQARGDAPSFRRLVDDVAEYLTALPRGVPDGPPAARMPVFLAAISWGGKIAAALERRHPGLVDGLILLCPGFFPRVKPSLAQRLKIALARLLRKRTCFPIPLNDPELFTTTPRWLQFLRDDPLRLHHATARLLVESVRLDRYLRAVPKYMHVPVLLLLAERDRIIRNERTRAYIEHFATQDKEIVEYPGAQHTLEFEPEPDRFIDDILRWLQKRIGGERG